MIEARALSEVTCVALTTTSPNSAARVSNSRDAPTSDTSERSAASPELPRSVPSAVSTEEARADSAGFASHVLRLGHVTAQARSAASTLFVASCTCTIALNAAASPEDASLAHAATLLIWATGGTSYTKAVESPSAVAWTASMARRTA